MSFCLLNDHSALLTGLPAMAFCHYGLAMALCRYSTAMALCRYAYSRGLRVPARTQVRSSYLFAQHPPMAPQRKPKSWSRPCRTSFPAPVLPLCLLFTLLQPHWPPCCSSNTPGMLLPHGLCTGCSLSLECSSMCPHDSLLHFLQAFAQMLSSQWGCPVHRLKTNSLTPCTLSSLPYLLYFSEHVIVYYTVSFIYFLNCLLCLLLTK